MPRILPLFVTGIAAVRLHRARDRPRRRHVHRRYRYPHDWLRGPPVRRDRAILGVLLPLGVSGRSRRGFHVRGWYDVRF
jgi:hypothetical protein